jgi:hypothetical protein
MLLMNAKKKNKFTWGDFGSRVSFKGYDYDQLKRLDDFKDSILVTGCQRSGTTMLARIITESDGMFNYWFGDDDELDAALILAGIVPHEASGRYCFQTTYLNERYHEYYQHKNGHKLIWVLRHPYSVIYSMLYNWSNVALYVLFKACSFQLINNSENIRMKLFGKYGLSRLRQACYAYVGKTNQAFELKDNMSEHSIMFIEYEQLVKDKHTMLPEIYNFLNLPYNKNYADKIHQKSLDKANKLTKKEKSVIDEICLPVFDKAISTLITATQ